MKDLKKIWLISLFIKLVLAAILPLSADEAYYWVWSHNMRLSYFDHPPMVAWLFYSGHFLEDFMNAVRWPTVLLGHATLLVWISLLKPHVDVARIKVWIYLALFSPLIGFGSIIVTPDVPVVFFWSLSLLALQNVLQTHKLKHYLFLGAALGLGFCAKYHVVLFLPVLFVFLIAEGAWRKVHWKYVPLTILTGLLFCTPVILWNYQNDFSSFKFQLNHGLGRSHYEFEWTWGYLAAQIAIVSPMILWAALRAHIPKAARLFYYFGFGPLLFFFATSFKALVEANWPIIAYPAVFALALFHPKIRTWTKGTNAFWSILYVVVLAALFIPQFRNLNEKISEPFRLKEMAPLVSEYAPLYGNSYQVSSSLWYYSKTPVYKLAEISRIDFFDTLPEGRPTENVFYVLNYEGNGLPAWVSEQGYEATEIKKIAPDFVLFKVSK